MVGVTTIALLERKPTISRDLFSRYWRDVHGVMAARIPGFDSYIQHHVTPADAASEPFEGIAVVGFASEDDRMGLATSAMTGHIHRDEQNVFRRALLYNLPSDAVQGDAGDADGSGCFVVVPHGVNGGAVLSQVRACGPASLRQFNLTGGDPAAWNDTDVDDAGRGRRFVLLVEASWAEAHDRNDAIASLREFGVGVYVTDEVHAMVLGGRATPVGLRGLDAVRTIREAGADNQFDPAVEDALYGHGGTTPN